MKTYKAHKFIKMLMALNKNNNIHMFHNKIEHKPKLKWNPEHVVEKYNKNAISKKTSV